MFLTILSTLKLQQEKLRFSDNNIPHGNKNSYKYTMFYKVNMLNMFQIWVWNYA